MSSSTPDQGGHATECIYPVPVDVLPTDVTSITIRVNYRGPKLAQQRWEWALLDGAGNWQVVGDNSAAADWSWTELAFTVSGTPSDYITAGALNLVYRTSQNVDASDLDYQVVELHSNGLTKTSGVSLFLPLVRRGVQASPTRLLPHLRRPPGRLLPPTR